MRKKFTLSKKLILFLATGSIIFTLRAQDYTRPSLDTPPVPVSDDKKFSLGFSIGPAIPMRDFGSSNVSGSFWDQYSNDSTRLQGFAKTGFHFNITASYMFSNEWGIMLTFGSSSMPFDVNTFSNIIGYPTTINGGYSVNEYLIGPYISLNLVPKLNLKVSALVGIVDIAYPELSLAVNDTVTETLDFQGGLNFGYSFGAGFEYNVSSSIGIFLNVAYTGSTITYGGWTQTYSAPGYYPFTISHSNDATTMTTGLLKQTIGIEVKF